MRVRVIRLAAAVAAIAAALAAAGEAPADRPAPALAQSPATPWRPYAHPVDRWLGESRAVAVDGDHAYFAVGRAIAVADIRDPAAARLVGRSRPLPLAPDNAAPPPITDVAAADGFVWAVTRRADDGVAVFDARDPARPRLVAQVPLTGGPPYAVSARGRECVVALQSWSPDRTDAGLVVLRIVPVGHVIAVSRWHDASVAISPSDVVWVGDRIFVSGSPNEIGIFSISGEAGAPRELTLRAYHGVEWSSGSNLSHLAVDGCRLYALGHDSWDVGGGAGGVTAYDICQDGAPVRLGWFGSSELYEHAASGIAAVTLGGRSYALIADSHGSVVVLDATEPAAEWPATPLIDPVSGVHGCRSGVAVVGRLVLSTGCGLMTAILADDVPRAVRTGHLLGLASFGLLEFPAEWRAHATMAGAHILVVHAGVAQLVDPAAPIAPAVVGRVAIAPGGETNMFQYIDAAAAATSAWIAGASGPVIAVDLRDPRSPAVVGDLGMAAAALAASGNLVAAASWSADSISLFDVTDPAHPREVGRVPADTSYVHDIVFGHDRLYASGGRSGLQVIDIRDPARPHVLAADRTDEDVLRVAADDVIAVATDSTGLRVYDLAGVPQGRLDITARVPFAGTGLPSAREVVSERLALVHAGGRRIALLHSQQPAALLAVDVTDPAHPATGPLWRAPVPFEAMTVAADRAYLFGGLTGAEFSVIEAGALAVAAALSLPYLSNSGF